jgi:hypothetical protein
MTSIGLWEISNSRGIRCAMTRKYSFGFSILQILIASAPCCSKSSTSAVRNAWLNLFLTPLARPPVFGRPGSNGTNGISDRRLDQGSQPLFVFRDVLGVFGLTPRQLASGPFSRQVAGLAL